MLQVLRNTNLENSISSSSEDLQNDGCNNEISIRLSSKGQRRLRNETLVSKNLELPQQITVSFSESGSSDYGIGFINGMGNTLSDAKNHALRLSAYSKSKVHLVFDPTRGVIKDVLDAVVAKNQVSNTRLEWVEHLLLKQWEEYFSMHGPDAKFLQICHSKGAIHVKNALRAAPQQIRDKIVVTAIAPASIIVPGECLEIHNYISTKDLWLIKMHRELSPGICKHITMLEPIALVVGNDHSFDSKTYEHKLKESIAQFIMANK